MRTRRLKVITRSSCAVLGLDILRSCDRAAVELAQSAQQGKREAGEGNAEVMRDKAREAKSTFTACSSCSLGQVRPQPVAGGLSAAIREFHQVGFAGEIALAGNAGDEVLGGLHAVTGLGEFVAQMIRALGSGILRAVANEANIGRPDEGNQLIDFRLRLRIQAPTRSRR